MRNVSYVIPITRCFYCSIMVSPVGTDVFVYLCNMVMICNLIMYLLISISDILLTNLQTIRTNYTYKLYGDVLHKYLYLSPDPMKY